MLREDADVEEVSIDSMAIRAYQHAAGAAKKGGGNKRLAVLVLGSAYNPCLL